jgi:hypothetical protein
MSDPRVHAAYMKDVVASLARLGAEGARMRAADPELMREVEAAPRSAWLPIALNLRWVEAAERAFGWPGAQDFLAARVRDQLRGPLFRSFVEGGVHLLGLDPGTLARVIPRGIAITFRECGTWSAVRTSDASAELRASGLPKELAGHARWIESVGASALAMFALCRVAGRVELAAHDRERGSAVIAAHWTPRGR